MTPDEIKQLRDWQPEQMARRIVKFADLDWSSQALLDSALPGCGAQLAPVIGHGISQERQHLAPVMNSHGFSIEWLKIPAQGSVSQHSIAAKQVVLMYQGDMQIEIDDKTTVKLKGYQQGNDAYAMPAQVWRRYQNPTNQEALALLITPGDERKTIIWAPASLAAAAQAGYTIDANGYAGQKKFIDRSQR